VNQLAGGCCHSVLGKMAEELMNMWGRLTLMEDEDVRLGIDEQGMAPLVDRGHSCAVGRLLADRIVGKDIIKVPLLHAWQPTGRVSFKTLGPNLFLIDFEHEWDKSRIMEGRPWTFDGHLVSLLDFDGITPPSQLNFEKAAFWIRMYELPLACMGKEVGQQIGATVGEVEEVEADEDGVGWGEYLRVRVVIDLAKPLARGRTITIRNKTLWVPFKYEKIPKYCFRCGVVRHGTRGCVRVGSNRANSREVETEFGPWLRVPSPTRRRGMGGGWARGDRWGRNQQERYQADNRSQHQGKNVEEEEGGGGTGNGGGSAWKSPAPAKGRSINESRISSQYLSIGGSGNNEVLMANEGAVMKGGDQQIKARERFYGDRSSCNEEVYMERRILAHSEKERIIGERSSSNEAVDGGILNKKLTKVNNSKGKSVYIGQWDSIKEKMIWGPLDKANDAQLITEVPEGIKLQGKIKEVGEAVQQEVGANHFIFGSHANISAGKETDVSLEGPRSRKKRVPKKQAASGRDGGGDSSGKRKYAGVDIEVNLTPGKRNKNYEETEEGNTVLAEAAMQPRQQL
jgi:hypothetical protein